MKRVVLLWKLPGPILFARQIPQHDVQGSFKKEVQPFGLLIGDNSAQLQSFDRILNRDGSVECLSGRDTAP
jgi:hypothetical protein